MIDDLLVCEGGRGRLIVRSELVIVFRFRAGYCGVISTRTTAPEDRQVVVDDVCELDHVRVNLRHVDISSTHSSKIQLVRLLTCTWYAAAVIMVTIAGGRTMREIRSANTRYRNELSVIE